jgi:hypothetical protein
MMKRALVVSLVLLPAAARADDILLKGGGRLSGVIVERTASTITLDTGPGRVTLPMSRVTSVVARTADLTVYRKRAAALLPDNVAGWLALGDWAGDHGLLTQAREAYAYVLTLDPENAPAHRALGHVWTGERWATLEESYRARGFIPFEGSWVSPDEHRAIIEERMAAAAADRDRAEAAARVREAEARARVAEAEARMAESAPAPGSIPMDMAYGGYGGYGYGGYGYGGAYGGYGAGYDPYGQLGAPAAAFARPRRPPAPRSPAAAGGRRSRGDRRGHETSSLTFASSSPTLSAGGPDAPDPAAEGDPRLPRTAHRA